MDTEVLVDAVRDVFRDNLDGIRVLDMCAGTGCVGLAIAANLPFCRVLLADKSQEALKISRSNTMKNNLTRRVTSIELDALEAPPMLLGLFDIIVCNPPYIPTDDLKELDPSVREFEPAMALDGVACRDGVFADSSAGEGVGHPSRSAAMRVCRS